ncbi:MAG: zinc-ribbon domain-containing protein [Clostridia bacterium]|nr:zinc-ribbon domain-containing protein [Clostridia bacterium]
MADKTLVCKDCNNEFIFSEGEQAFYKEKGFENEPQRCPDCRKAKKQQRNNNRGFGGGGGNNNRGKSFGNRW